MHQAGDSTRIAVFTELAMKQRSCAASCSASIAAASALSPAAKTMRGRSTTSVIAYRPGAMRAIVPTASSL